MTEVHDPLRLLMIVEHDPVVVAKSIQRSAATYEWFINNWINLVAVHPETQELYRFKSGYFEPYHTLQKDLPLLHDLKSTIESNTENLPVYLIAQP
nr:hypothetical protein [Haliscomenobacter sp.]